MSKDIRVGDLIEVRWDGTETRVVGRVKSVRNDLFAIDGYGHVWSDVPGRTVTVLERPEPPMEPLPTEFGAHIVATVGGTERELIRYPTGQWVDRDGFSYRADQVTAWRWAKNPRPLPTLPELYDLGITDVKYPPPVAPVLDYLKDAGYGS